MWLDRFKLNSYVFLLIYFVAFNYAVFHAAIDFFSIDITTQSKNKQSITQLSSFKATALNTIDQADTDELKWHNVELPDDWHQHSQDQSTWLYKSPLNIQHIKAEQLGVYLPSVTHNAAIYINDIWIGQGGSFADPVSRHHNEPLLFSFSSKLLKPNNNTIKLIVKTAYYKQGLLDHIYIGDYASLKPHYEWKHFLRLDFIHWVTMAMYVMAALLFVFWISRPQDVVYGIFSFELFIWATHNLNLFVSSIPMSSRLWEAMTMSTLGWTVIAMIFFNHRYIGIGSKTIEKFIFIFGLCGTGLFFIPDIGSILSIGYGVWDSFLLVFGSYAILHLIYAYYKKTDVDTYLMLMVGIPILVFGLHDILLVNHIVDRRHGLIIQYSVIPASLLFTWFLVCRFIKSLNNAEQLAQTLEDRVAEKQLALHTQYEQLKVLERESVLAEERERIMRDMHDGIGGQLVSTLVMLQNYKGEVYEKVRHKIQHSLTDLRFVIDSLDPLLNDIPTLLGMMRLRLVDQLDAADIELEWAVTDLPEVKDMSPGRCLHIMRIVQEAISNSIKHSGAHKMRLQTGLLDDNNIFIDIHDYGNGIQNNKQSDDEQNELKPNGRGIDNMQFRAKQLGGELQVNNTENGACVRLILATV